MDLLTAYAASYATLAAACADGWATPPAALVAECDAARGALKGAIEDLIKAEMVLDAAEAWSVESYQPPPSPAALATMRANVSDLRTKIGLNQG